MPDTVTVPEGAAPEGPPGSPKREEAVEIEEPPNKRARTSELSPELESKFLHLMEQTRKGFEVTGNALSSVQEHVDLLKRHSKELSDLASELHVSRVSEKYYLSQLQSLYAAFGQIEWQLAGPKSESNTSMKSVLNKLLGAHTATKEGMKAVHQEIKEGHEKVVEAIQKGFGTLCSAMLKQPITVRDGPGGSSSAFPPTPAPPAMPAVPAAPPAPLHGMPGYASAPVMTAPLTPSTPPVVMPSGSTGTTAPSGAESSEARVPLVLIAADEAGNRKKIAVSPTRHQNTQHLNTNYLHEFGLGCIAHQGFYHRRLPDIFLPK